MLRGLSKTKKEPRRSTSPDKSKGSSKHQHAYSYSRSRKSVEVSSSHQHHHRHTHENDPIHRIEAYEEESLSEDRALLPSMRNPLESSTPPPTSSGAYGSTFQPDGSSSTRYSSVAHTSSSSSNASSKSSSSLTSSPTEGGSHDSDNSDDDGTESGTEERRRGAEDASQSRSASTLRSSSAGLHVTIPRGLKPKEVPMPLRATECGGRVPVSAPSSRQADRLFRRWERAHTNGTASTASALSSAAAQTPRRQSPMPSVTVVVNASHKRTPKLVLAPMRQSSASSNWKKADTSSSPAITASTRSSTTPLDQKDGKGHSSGLLQGVAHAAHGSGNTATKTRVVHSPFSSQQLAAPPQTASRTKVTSQDGCMDDAGYFMMPDVPSNTASPQATAVKADREKVEPLPRVAREAAPPPALRKTSAPLLPSPAPPPPGSVQSSPSSVMESYSFSPLQFANAHAVRGVDVAAANPSLPVIGADVLSPTDEGSHGSLLDLRSPDSEVTMVPVQAATAAAPPESQKDLLSQPTSFALYSGLNFRPNAAEDKPDANQSSTVTPPKSEVRLQDAAPPPKATLAAAASLPVGLSPVTSPASPVSVGAETAPAASGNGAKLSKAPNPSFNSVSGEMRMPTGPPRTSSSRTTTLAEAQDLYRDGRVRTVAVCGTHASCGFEVQERGNTKVLVRTSDSNAFPVDEVRLRQTLPAPLQAAPVAMHTEALSSLFSHGDNAAVLSFDGRSDNVFGSPAWNVLAECVEKALRHANVVSREVRMAVSLVRVDGEALDLMDTSGASLQPLQVAASPLFGAAVHTSRLHPVTSLDALHGMLYQAALNAKQEWSNMSTFLHVLLVNVFRTPAGAAAHGAEVGKDGDVVVSSLTLAVFGSHAATCKHVLVNTANKAVSSSPASAENAALFVHPEVLRLLHGPLSGAAATVFLMSLSNASDASAAVEMAQTEVARMTKQPLRYGSVSEFVQHTRRALERRRAKALTVSAEERTRMERIASRITEMLDDYTALLNPKTQSFPKAYLNNNHPKPATVPTAAATIKPSTVAATASGDGDGDGKAKSRDVAHEQMIAAPPRQEAVEKPNTMKVEVERRYGAAPHANHVTKKASFLMPAAPTANASPKKQNALHPPWVLGVEVSGAAMKQVRMSRSEVVWTPTRERFETDSVLFYESTSPDMKCLFTEKCEPVCRLVDRARAAESCTILGLVDTGNNTPPRAAASLHVRSQPLWRSYTALVLNSCFHGSDEKAASAAPQRGNSDVSNSRGNKAASKTWREGSEVHFRFCAVQDRTLIHDFLRGDDDNPENSNDGRSTYMNTPHENYTGSTPPFVPPPRLPTRVALASTPLVGPVVRNTTSMRANNLSECQYVLSSGLDALNAVAESYPGGTIIIANAVLKNVTENDVHFSSLTAFGVRVGRDLPALRDILAMDPKGGAPPSLYRYALRGPCHLLCLTTLNAGADAQCVEALRLSQGIRYGNTPPVPTGSLRSCVEEQEKELQQRSYSTPQLRANADHMLRQLTTMLEDPLAPIFIFPFDDESSDSDSRRGPHDPGCFNGPAAASRSSNSMSAGGRCRCTAIITTAGCSVSPRLSTIFKVTSVGASPQSIEVRTDTNAVRVAKVSYPVTEVVLRADNSSVLRPGLISSITQHVQQGRNAALIVADSTDSLTGVPLISKVIGMLTRNCGDTNNLVSSPDGGLVNTTLFMSIVAARFPTPDGLVGRGGNGATAPAEATVKDLFNAEPNFYPLRVARSPLFGSCVDGARFSSLSRIGDVYLTLKDAQKACCFLNATLVVVVVLKQIIMAPDGTTQDVRMSSLLCVVNSAEANQDSGHCACDVFHAMLNQREEAELATDVYDDPRARAWRNCLLADALGGETFTYGVVGINAHAEATEATALMQFGCRLMTVPCRPPAVSSARSLLRRAELKLAEGEQQQQGTTGGAADELMRMAWDWSIIKAEAEDMLFSPGTCKPRAFLCE